MSLLPDIPEVVKDGVLVLGGAIANLLMAPSADARRAVYMDTAEEMKRLADREKFGR